MGDFRSDRGWSSFGRRPGGRSSFGGRSNFRNRDDRERPEMHEVTCDKCKKQCEVPFRPTAGKPVFCSDCFKTQDRPRDNFDSRDSQSGISQEQFKQINIKLDKIIEFLDKDKPKSKK